jgi:branched-chain amino acid transport system ATP-binding protein
MALLEISGLAKSFGGIVALSDVSISVDEAEAVGIVGPNGAGKTTLFDCVAGLCRPDAGTVSFAGESIDGMPAFRRSLLGIGRTFQRLELFTGMTPREHVLVAARVHAGTGRLWRDLTGLGRPSPAELRAADGLLAAVGLTEVAGVPVEALSLGRARLVELARALATAPSLLMLDEPSSGLDEAERTALLGAIARVRAERRAAVLLVEHDLGVVAAAVERLVVLDSGRVIADGPVAESLGESGVRRAFLGVGP